MNPLTQLPATWLLRLTACEIAVLVRSPDGAAIRPQIEAALRERNRELSATITRGAW